MLSKLTRSRDAVTFNLLATCGFYLTTLVHNNNNNNNNNNTPKLRSFFTTGSPSGPPFKTVGALYQESFITSSEKFNRNTNQSVVILVSCFFSRHFRRRSSLLQVYKMSEVLFNSSSVYLVLIFQECLSEIVSIKMNHIFLFLETCTICPYKEIDNRFMLILANFSYA